MTRRPQDTKPDREKRSSPSNHASTASFDMGLLIVLDLQ